MRITMMIDHLGGGGAERQFCMLAGLLQRRGHDVRAVVFQPDVFSAPDLIESGIPIVSLKPRSVIHLVWLVRRAIRDQDDGVVVTFLKWSSLMAEVAGLPFRKFTLIASERILDVTGSRIKRRIRYLFHHLADLVVCNAYAQRDRMVAELPIIRDRLRVVVNGVDLRSFSVTTRPIRSTVTCLHILVLARFAEQKNPFALVNAISLLRTFNPELRIFVDWYGRIPTTAELGESRLAAHRRAVTEAQRVHTELAKLVTDVGLEDRISTHQAQKDVVSLYHSTDVVCLPSTTEGCSNTIGEALACGVPVLAGRVSDNPRLVIDGTTGYTFNPHSVDDIANKILDFTRLSVKELKKMRYACRAHAERLLNPEVLADRFLELVVEANGRVKKRGVHGRR